MKDHLRRSLPMADDVLYPGVRGVTDLMVMPGLINLDFADIRTVMAEMGKAMMGTGEAEGEDRATQAAERPSPTRCWTRSAMKGARGVLINITGGTDMTLFEVDEAANRIRERSVTRTPTSSSVPPWIPRWKAACVYRSSQQASTRLT